MAYTQAVRALRRSLQQTCRTARLGLLVHTHRTVSTAVSTVTSTSTFHRRTEVPGSLLPTLCCFTQANTVRCVSVDFRLRNKSSSGDRDKSVSRFQGGGQASSTAQKVKNAGRDFTYLIVILFGLGVTGGLLYVVFQELFSSSSPNKVYGKAFNKVKSNPEVIGAFGEPIKCYGETTRRGRRQQVSHMEFQKDGLKHLRLKFYIEGSEQGLKGTVHSESKENVETGKYEFRYIFVEVDAYPRRTIVVEDNR